MTSEAHRSHLNFFACHSLKYTIAGASQHSGSYVAENIMKDEPTDHTSRWSGAEQTPTVKQWITLKLDSLAIVNSITFGKFNKPHPCNMKEFRLLVGTSEDNLVQVLHAGLKNDGVPETFSIPHTNQAGISFPTRYVQIIPLSAHGQSFHTSIWFVSLSGITEESHVERIRANYETHRETLALKHILKHLRQRRLLTPIQFIQSKCNIQLEHPLVASLYDSVVLKGQFSAAEGILKQCLETGLFTSFIKSSQPHAIWTRINAVDADGDAPMKRGGHAMCIDSDNGLIYLHGGWDGQKSLDDFWLYDIAKEKWRVLSQHSGNDKNGPSPRACHKMVFDRKTGSIYLLGKLADEEGPRMAPDGSAPDTGPAAGDQQFCSEFYRYRTRGLDAGNWELLNFDTMASGGPPLIFDHQLAMDSDAQIIYVFGGRVVDGERSPAKYSGLFSYDVRSSKWRNLQPDMHQGQTIPCRFGHSMLLDPESRILYIFAGQREDRYFSDMWTYDIATGSASEIWSNFTASGGPDPCFTQRAVINTKWQEIYMLCGLTRSRTGSSSKTELRTDIPKWVYRYEKQPGSWVKILPDREISGGRKPSDRPRPRYAHQMVYDPKTDAVFMHGGNGGVIVEGEEDRGEEVREEDENRLDDFWIMKLKRIAPEELIRRATFKLRTQQFREMCEEQPPVKALNFLQTEVSSVVDHSSMEEAAHFRSLLTHLLNPGTTAHPIAFSGSGTRRARDNQQEGPRKKSRSEDTWTSRLDDDEDSPSTEHAFHSLSPSENWLSGLVSNMEEDPVEEVLRGDPETKPPSAERFKQRTEVFETLLEFVDEHAKEPDGSLVDRISQDD